MATALAPAPVPSNAVAAYLGPPSKYAYRKAVGLSPDDALRSVELAEAALHFGSTQTPDEARYAHRRALELMPSDLPLHYKVWELLIATRRHAEAEASYRAVCERNACSPHNGPYHACVLTSAALHPRTTRPPLPNPTPSPPPVEEPSEPPPPPPDRQLLDRRRAAAWSHIITLPQPATPPELAGARRAAFRAFNPAIVALPAPDEEEGAAPASGANATAVSRAAAADDGAKRYVVFFRYSNVRSLWSVTPPRAWQRVLWSEWREALSPAATSPPPASTAHEAGAVATPAEEEEEEAHAELSSVMEHVRSVAAGVPAPERWRSMMESAEMETAERGRGAGGRRAEGESTPMAEDEAAAEAEAEAEGSLEIYDVEVDEASGVELALPSERADELARVFSSAADADEGDDEPVHGLSLVGYMLVELTPGGALSRVGDVRWLSLARPFAACARCEPGWAELPPAACDVAARHPAASALLLVALGIGGLHQLLSGLKRLARLRSAGGRLSLARGLMMLCAAMSARVCSVSSNGVCRASAGGEADGTERGGPNAPATAAAPNATPAAAAPPLPAAGAPSLNTSRGPDAAARASRNESGGSVDGRAAAGARMEYDGYEDARVIVHGGRIRLLASHEDCDGRRRLVLLELGGEAERGTLAQRGTWVLRVEGAGGGGGGGGGGDAIELQDDEKNWVPFVVGGVLHLSYSLQPHVVLRCAWTGGACHAVASTTSDFIAMYSTLHQHLRGGTPYASLRDGSRLSALHVKDTAHAPALYGTIFFIAEEGRPFRILSLSPKLCFSTRSLELAISARCALQYVTGLEIDEASNLALISYGELDFQMKLAALPLDAVVSLARTHVIDVEDGHTVSESLRSYDPYVS